MHIIISLVITAYVLYFLYDWCNVAHPDFRFGKGLFAAATALLIISTCLYIYISIKHTGGTINLIFLILAFLALVGLVVSVFFCLPSGTYSEPGVKRKAFNGKLYALCRHPGVLTYCLFYIFLFLAMQDGQGLMACAVFCTADLLYMFFQDFWSFPRIFLDYEHYKRETPMFFPTTKSIGRCIASYKENRSALERREDR